MKILKEKKGFTLIELLAVIVVLAIVMVLATTTVLPYMATARKEAFALEANTAQEAAAQAISLITIGSVTSNYTKTDTGYCFTIADLRALGLFTKEDTNYAGVVQVVQTGNAYNYLVKMKNSAYYVSQAVENNAYPGDVTKDDIKDVTTGTNAKPTSTEVPTTCS